jgi:RNA polymerase sigma-70 factor (ECF subfamily)
LNKEAKGRTFLTDEKLIEATLAGNDEAFRELVIRYEPRVAATVIGMLGKGPEAEDVGQETFIRFFKSLRDFRGESSVGTYLTRIAINLSLNELKKRKRRSLFFRAESGESFDIPDESASKGYSGEKEVLQRALQKLDIQFRSVIVLRLMDGYSTEETANILNIPIGTVLSRLARAQHKLKKILSPIYEE